MSREEVASKDKNVSVTGSIAARIEEVWPYIASVGTEKLWLHGCTRSALESGYGKGAIRTMHFSHGVYRERIEDCDSDNFRFVYRVLEPHPIPAKEPIGVVQLERDGPNKTMITWTSTGDDWDPELRESTARLARQTYENTFAALRRICEFNV